MSVRTRTFEAVIDDRKLRFKRTLDASRMVEIAETVDDRPGLESWRYCTIIAVADDVPHGVTVHQSWCDDAPYENIVATYRHGQLHGKMVKTILCISPSGTYNWRITERSVWADNENISFVPALEVLGRTNDV